VGSSPKPRRGSPDAVKLPQGYSVDWGGQFENFARARERLSIIMPITLGVIFILLFVAFGDRPRRGPHPRHGAVLARRRVVALYARGMHLNVSAAVGFISLFGVAVMSGCCTSRR
jgi:cobalt-zinc-cadmium resistance protein CzcA